MSKPLPSFRSDTPTLFMVYLGGRAAGANIELHDVQFVAGCCIEVTFPMLQRAWFGDDRGLHLDSVSRITSVDGYHVHLRSEPAMQPEKLWFVNLGAYSPHNPAELHGFSVFIAEKASDARRKAQQSLLTEAVQQHKDDLLDVDDCFSIESANGYQIHLQSGAECRPLQPDWFGYHRIDHDS